MFYPIKNQSTQVDLNTNVHLKVQCYTTRLWFSINVRQTLNVKLISVKIKSVKKQKTIDLLSGVKIMQQKINTFNIIYMTINIF